MDKNISNIIFLDSTNYYKFRVEIIELYLHSFTTGDYAQQITIEEAEEKLDKMIDVGFGRMIFNNNQLTGLIIAYPFNLDNDYPFEVFNDISRDKSLYIAEVMIHKDFRGRGYAKELISDLLMHASKEYTDVFIRVWSANKPALDLYKKMGFDYITSISQHKINKLGNPFIMEKYYMHKHISGT